MKHSDPVMQELWNVKDSQAKQHGSLTNYIAFLRTLAKNKTGAKRGPKTASSATPQRRG
jgi:hypothetical protein